MRVVPLTIREANAFVSQYHRHHRPSQGGKFAVGADIGGKIVGAMIAGRPVARGLDDGSVVEVIRLATDGTPNACSLLYGAAARISREMGYKRIVTYILASEPGTSLKASGWLSGVSVKGRSWSRPKRSRTDKAPTCDKVRWERVLS